MAEDSNVARSPHGPDRLLIPAWFASWTLAVLLTLLGGDPLPAGIFIIVVVLQTMLPARLAILTAVGPMLTGGVLIAVGGLEGWSAETRSDGLVLMMLTPIMVAAVSAPSWWNRRSADRAVPLTDQSSINSMSDATGGGTLGRITPVRKQSRAA